MVTNRIFGVVAPKRSGKTYTTAQWVEKQQNILVFDFHDDDDDDFKKLSSLEHIKNNPKALARAMSVRPFQVRYVPDMLIPKGNYALCPALNWVCKFCFEVGNMTLVVDEAHLYMTPYNIPQPLLQCAMMGGNRRLSLLYITQSFAAVHNAVTRNTDEFWFWKIHGPADLDNIKQRCGKSVAEQVSQLARLEEVNGVVTPGGKLRWTVERGVEDFS